MTSSLHWDFKESSPQKDEFLERTELTKHRCQLDKMSYKHRRSKEDRQMTPEMKHALQ